MIDPDRITKIEICCVTATRVEVRIFSPLHAEPEVFEFPDKARAVEFCREIWVHRGDGT